MMFETPVTCNNLSRPHETASGLLVFLDHNLNIQESCDFFQSLLLLFSGNISSLGTWLGSLNSGKNLLQQVELISCSPFPKRQALKNPQVLSPHAIKKSELLSQYSQLLHALILGTKIHGFRVTIITWSQHAVRRFRAYNHITVLLENFWTYTTQGWSISFFFF